MSPRVKTTKRASVANDFTHCGLEKAKKKVDIRTLLTKQMGGRAGLLTATQRVTEETEMVEVIEKYEFQYATQDKTFIGIKLTDSCLNSCLSFHKLKRKLIEGCKIKFNGNDGEISIPSSSGDRQFKFRSNGFNQEFDECLMQQKDTMFVTGMINKRMTVQGNEDAYQATKEKMTLVEQESKKNCTKVLDTGFSRFDKKPIRPQTLSRVQPSATNGNARSSLSGRLQLQVDPAEAASRRGSTCPRVPSGGGRNSKPATSPLEAKEAPLNLDFAAILSYTYRERIIHLLAIRPYKKIELQQVINRHGPSERDRQPWTTVLSSVANFSPRENSYSLRKICYQEVQEEWPFYDEETRQVIKKKLKELRGERSISPCSSSSGSSHNGEGSTGSGQTQKRPALEDYVVPSKKQRIAHAQKPALQDAITSSSYQAKAPQAMASSPQPAVTVTATQTVPVPAFESVPIPASQPVPIPASQPVPIPASQPVHIPASQPVPTPATLAASVASDTAVDYPLDEFVSNEELANLTSLYGPVRGKEQRDKYKAEFDAGSREYNWMFGLISTYIKVFAKLERKLKAARPSEIEAVQNEIYVHYLKLINDREYMSQRSALDRLKKKLNHIRAMIEDYDNRVLQQSS